MEADQPACAHSAVDGLLFMIHTQTGSFGVLFAVAAGIDPGTGGSFNDERNAVAKRRNREQDHG